LYKILENSQESGIAGVNRRRALFNVFPGRDERVKNAFGTRSLVFASFARLERVSSVLVLLIEVITRLNQ
jgi:hypothetical protein